MDLSDCSLARFALGIGAATLFAGCGESQLPIGAPGGIDPDPSPMKSDARQASGRISRALDTDSR
jgi:hypothetical protein